MNFINKYRAMVVVTAVLSVVLLGVVGTVVYGYITKRPPCMDRAGEPRGCNNNVDDFLLKQLNLNVEQAQDFMQAKAEFQQKHDSIGREIHKLSKQIIGEVMSDSVNNQLVNELIGQFGELQVQQKQMLVVHFTALKQKLTPEQYKVLKRMMCRMDRPAPPNKSESPRGHGARDCVADCP